MTIRTRLGLWYVGIIFLSMLAMVGLSYHEFVVEPREREYRRHHHSSGEKFDEEQMEEAMGIVLWCGIPAAVLALGGGWWLMRRALAPVAAITAAAERVSESNLREQLTRSRNGDEMDRLSEVFNAMISRLDSSFQRIREFTLHASHELKTPLTVLHGEMETALRDPALSTHQRERLLSELDEVQRLAKIVDGLTLLTKADAGQIILNLESIELEELVKDAHADAQILANASSVRVTLSQCDPATIRGDRHRLRQLLLNLTDNAIKYNKPSGTVEISLRRKDFEAEISVINSGPGISAELLPRVFERFFRGDPSHNNAVEGCGLGLSIAQWITHDHDGVIKISSIPSEFTRVVVSFPLEASHRKEEVDEVLPMAAAREPAHTN